MKTTFNFHSNSETILFCINIWLGNRKLAYDGNCENNCGATGRAWSATRMCAPALGGFNVSNLMGIKRRMIDIGKKITFYFLQNVWKCTVFFAFAFKVCKKCCYDPKNFFLKNSIMGIKKTRILCWFQIHWCRLKQMPLKKARAKKLCEFWVFSFLCIFSWFFAFNFC